MKKRHVSHWKYNTRKEMLFKNCGISGDNPSSRKREGEGGHGWVVKSVSRKRAKRISVTMT